MLRGAQDLSKASSVCLLGTQQSRACVNRLGESSLSDSRLRLITAIGLVIGAVLGMAGTFAPSASLRGLAWGVDGTALVVASALLAVHHFHRGNDLAAAG